MSRVNPREEWIVTKVPESRVIDAAFWRAVKERQEELTAILATIIKAAWRERANHLSTPTAPVTSSRASSNTGPAVVLTRYAGRIATAAPTD